MLNGFSRLAHEVMVTLLIIGFPGLVRNWGIGWCSGWSEQIRCHERNIDFFFFFSGNRWLLFSECISWEKKRRKTILCNWIFFRALSTSIKYFSHWVVEMESLSYWNRGAKDALSKIQIVECTICQKLDLSQAQFAKSLICWKQHLSKTPFVKPYFWLMATFELPYGLTIQPTQPNCTKLAR